MVMVKVCGMTSLDDALAAVEEGADAVGFILAPSPRRISLRAARAICGELPSGVLKIGVFVDEDPDLIRYAMDFCGLDMVQLHGTESEDRVRPWGDRAIKGVAIGRDPLPGVDAYRDAVLLLDTGIPGRRGGTGRTFDWGLVVPLARQRRIILAGGLDPGNVRRAIDRVRPWGVDVCSGIEERPGRKDHDRLRCFISRAKSR